MSKQSFSVQFTKKQVEYLMQKTGAEDPDEAIEIFAYLITGEKIDPSKMPLYVNKLMDKDGVK